MSYNKAEQPLPPAEGAEDIAGKRLKEILGDRLCNFCPLEKKGVYGVPGGFMAGCEGSKCDEALDEAMQKFAAQQQPTAEGTEDYGIIEYKPWDGLFYFEKTINANQAGE